MNKILCCYLSICFVLILSVKCEGESAYARCPRHMGFCVEIKDCPDINELVRQSLPPPLPKHVIKILRNRHCGVRGKNPLTCCSHKTKEILNLPEPKSIIPLPPDVSNNKNLYMLPIQDCGRNAEINVRITGGTQAELNEFPWMALLFFNNSGTMHFKCAGTVISNFYILTAAHCVYNQEYFRFVVRLGDYNVFTENDCMRNGYCAPSVQDIIPARFIVHSGYSSSKQTNDIALIQLREPASFAYENVQPICLPVGEHAKLNLIHNYLTVSGWGKTNSGFKSATLLKTEQPVLSIEACNKFYKNHEINYKQICAGVENGQDSCKGDSGGPLKHIVGYDDGVSRYIQYGIVSYGPQKCGVDGHPAIYTNVAYYMDWILEFIKP